MKRNWAIAAVIWALMLSLAEAGDGRDEQMERVIADIAANEQLYRDCELILSKEYRRVNVEAFHRPTTGLIDESSSEFRTVFQGKWFYSSRDEKSVLADGKKFHAEMAAGYDGEKTRVRWNKIGNVHLGRHDPNTLMRPHTILLERAFVGSMPLSEFLGLKRHGGWKVRAVLDGREVVNGLKCLRIRRENWKNDGEKRSYRLLWLAIERNYIPVKSIFYAAGYSFEIPLETSEVGDWREIAPGVWLPFSAEMSVNDELSAAKGIEIESNHTRFGVKKIDLDPKYDVEFFRDVDLPEDAVVYDVRGGKIVD